MYYCYGTVHQKRPEYSVGIHINRHYRARLDKVLLFPSFSHDIVAKSRGRRKRRRNFVAAVQGNCKRRIRGFHLTGRGDVVVVVTFIVLIVGG